MNLPPLSPMEFPEFFTRIHGRDREPFEWQKRLAATVSAEGWPRVLDLPTAAGKTAAIDIALFHLALEAGRGEKRSAPLRIAFVVDRRIVVDAAYDRACLIRDRLTDALKSPGSSDVLSRVARRLAGFGGEPLIVRALRGGVPREHDWARTPSQPTVLCSTVDQVGSRLLFRGYGVSDSMKPVHAGLLGSDCLILLDEAHLSEPFRQTLAAIEKYRKQPWTEVAPAPWNCVTLSATPRSRVSVRGGGDISSLPFSLTSAERADPRLVARLSASKPAQLVLAKARTTQVAAHSEVVAAQAWALSGVTDGGSPRVVAVVVNRVGLARRCHQQIMKLIEEHQANAEAVLFIGRSRDPDRVALMKLHSAKILSGSRHIEKTLFVIATQCIEAGADFDFDALVTQVAPLDALRQRFGRLNRLGRSVPARAAVLACPDEVGTHADDPLYGDRAKATWEWLLEQADEGVVDFGVEAMEARMKRVQEVETLVTDKKNAPVVMPVYVDLWAQTSPLPAADPEPALFLHGRADAADVQIVWRADVEPAETRERTLFLLTLAPPRAAETLSVPIRAARAWLSGADVLPVNDVEGGTVADDDPVQGSAAICAFRWQGGASDESRPVNVRQIRAGDVLVVPSTRGGCDEFGWNPSSKRRVRDLAAEAFLPFAARRFVFRVHRRLLEDDVFFQYPQLDDADLIAKVEATWRRLDAVLQQMREEENAKDVADALASVAGLPDAWSRALRAIADCERPVSAHFPYDDEEAQRLSGVVFVAPRGVDLGVANPDESAEAVTDNDDAGSFRALPVELNEHSVHVETWATGFARDAGLRKALAQDVALAAFLHDEGKRDERFQLYLRRGNTLQWLLDTRALAKSAMRPATRALDATARQRSELPHKWRHEADSVRRALEHSRFSEANDRLLVLWLVGTHHGYGRPLYPHTDERATGPQDPDFQVDGLDWPQVFATLLKRYGAWELARLEALVRLADHRASEEEDSRGEGLTELKGRLEVGS